MAEKKNCKKCRKEFLIIDQEAEFYKEKGYPLPTACPTCRQKARVAKRNERELYGYNCDNCSKQIIVAFEPSNEQQIFCKKCYQNYMEQNDCILGYSEGYKAQQGGAPQA